MNTLKNARRDDPSADYVGLDRLDREDLDEDAGRIGLERLDREELDEA